MYILVNKELMVPVILLSILNTVVTGFVAYIAWSQLSSYRKEEKRNRTVDICLKYDTDPIIASIIGKTRIKQSLSEAEKITLLNYFDTIAIGWKEGSYDWNIIFSQFKNIIPIQTEGFMDPDWEDGYPDLMGLVEQIKIDKQKTYGVQTK